MSTTTARVKEVMGDMTQEQFATTVHSTQPTISKVLRGGEPSASLIKGIAQHFHVSTDWLLGLSDDRYISQSSTEELLYSDALTVLAKMIEAGTLEFQVRGRTSEDTVPLDSDFQKWDVVRSEWQEVVLLIKDPVVEGQIGAVHGLSRIDSAVMEGWFRSTRDKYRLKVIPWGDSAESRYLHYKGQHGNEKDFLLEWVRDYWNGEAKIPF